MGYKDGYEDEYDEEVGPEMMAEAIENSNKVKMEEIKLVSKQLKSSLLDKAIFVSRSWRWWFMPNSYKLRAVIESFNTFKKALGD